MLKTLIGSLPCRSYTLRPVNGGTEGSTQETHMGAFGVLLRKVDKMV
jgi:hypothetical protein